MDNMNTGDLVTCYNNDSVSDYLSLGAEYEVESITSDGLVKLTGIDVLFCDWRFANNEK